MFGPGAPRVLFRLAEIGLIERAAFGVYRAKALAVAGGAR